MSCVQREHGVTVGTHTVNGINVGLSRRELGVSLICLETALPVKFAAAVRETLERVPEVPPGYEDQEQRLQRVAVMDANVESINSNIVARC